MQTLTSRFTLILLFICAITFSQNNINKEQLDKKLEKLQKATKTVGFSVAVIKGNTVIYSKGFGYRNKKENLKVDENTLFAIGSTSKAFTVGLLGIMEDEKGLSFNDSPKKFLPELEFYNDALNNEITILDMISHRTGLPRHDFSWYLFPTEDKDSLLARVKYHKPFTKIRKQWYYNNFMYLAQGLITEKLTDKSWEDNIRELFFKPLNMTRSNLTIKEMQNSSNISKGYVLENFTTSKVIPYYNIAAISPAGSINSSAKEMSNWLKVWLNDGKFNDTQVLPKKYIERAINPLMLVGNGIADPKFPDQHLNSYGFAWFTSSYKGHYRLEHGGNIDGFTANVAFFPTDKIGIVVLANQDGSALPTLVRNVISDEILDLEKTDWATYYEERITKLKEAKKKAKESEKSNIVLNTKPSHNLIEYIGKYNHLGYGNFTIKLQNDSLFATFPIKKMFLSHKHYDVFKPYLIEGGKIDSVSDLEFLFNFQTNNLGDIVAAKLKLEPTLDDIIFKRSPNRINASKKVLNKYVGTYLLSGTALKTYLKEDNLILFVPGQPEYTLIPIKENEFVIKNLTGYKTKIEAKNNTFNLVLIQPNGTFTAIRK